MRATTTSLVAGIVFGGLALAACGSADSAQPAPTTTVTTVTSTTTISAPSKTTAPPPADSTRRVLSTSGFGKLKFGMTEKEALATQEITLRQPGGAEGGCTGYHLTAFPNPTNAWIVTISPRYGIVGISAESGMRTPEEIGIGSTISDVEAAYGTVQSTQQYKFTQVPGHPEFTYRVAFGAEQRVSAFGLQAQNQDCAG